MALGGTREFGRSGFFHQHTCPTRCTQEQLGTSQYMPVRSGITKEASGGDSGVLDEVGEVSVLLAEAVELGSVGDSAGAHAPSANTVIATSPCRVTRITKIPSLKAI